MLFRMWCDGAVSFQEVLISKSTSYFCFPWCHASPPLLDGSLATTRVWLSQIAEFGMWLTQSSPPALTFTAILVCFSIYALEGVSDEHYLFSAGVTIWRGPSHQGGHKPMPLPPFILIMAHYMAPVENVSICGLGEIKAIISCEAWCCIQYFYCTWAEKCELHSLRLPPLDGSKGKIQAGGQANVFMVTLESLYSRGEHWENVVIQGRDTQECLLFTHVHLCGKTLKYIIWYHVIWSGYSHLKQLKMQKKCRPCVLKCVGF